MIGLGIKGWNSLKMGAFMGRKTGHESIYSYGIVRGISSLSLPRDDLKCSRNQGTD